ncbi:low-density lipoprotein receptor-related protein 4-like [Mytilus edulis]|uniref:low-density lipoprotein receptor-related protein 4-like n=1 Tax=Mytilus edulis TaxID=6550 RepID=UPI0039EFC138
MDVRVWFNICMIFYHTSAAESVRGKVLFANFTSINEIDVKTRIVTVLVNHGDSVYSLDYDYQNKYVYFPRYNLNYIMRFPYPSQNITLQHVVSTSLSPSGVAVDSANDHVYWVNNYGNTVSRCKLDGTNVVVVSNSLSNTFMIRLDVINRWLYIGYYNKGISKSRFDLTDMSMIANFTSNTYCMDIDLIEQRLYWMNYNGDIKSVNVDGSDVKTIISTNYRKCYYAIGVSGSYIYYADNNNQLVMMNKSQGSTPTVLYNDTSTMASIYVFKSTGMYITLT